MIFCLGCCDQLTNREFEMSKKYLSNDIEAVIKKFQPRGDVYASFLIIAFLASIGAILHYTLPQRDVVRIAGTEIIRSDFTGWNKLFYAQPDSGNSEAATRDVRLIIAVYPNGNVNIYVSAQTG